MLIKKADMGHCPRNEPVKFKSLPYDGVDYFLYDSVLFYSAGEAEAYVGKIVELSETADHVKKLKVVWFFRPAEIRKYLGDYKPQWNEIFLATGKGQGLSNINPLEAVLRKCKVVCTSNDPRNPPPSKAEVSGADYVFSRVFDVGELKISDKFADEIDGIRVENFFNAKKDLPSIPKENIGQKNAKRKPSECSKPNALEMGPPKKMILLENISDADNQKSNQLDPHKNLDYMPSSASITGSSEPSLLDKRKWFKKLPWKERLERAEETGTLLFLENLDPLCSSTEVEEIVLSALNERVDAKMIQQTAFSSPLNGKAAVIFKSKDAAQSALSRLTNGCLMLTDGRPVVARAGALRQPDKPSRFTGHYKIRQRKITGDMKTAVSTSHCAQSNTIEFSMAMEWRLLQEKSERWWKALHEEQANEIHLLKEQLKMKY